MKPRRNSHGGWVPISFMMNPWHRWMSRKPQPRGLTSRTYCEWNWHSLTLSGARYANR